MKFPARFLRIVGAFLVGAALGVVGGYCAGHATDISHRHPHSAANEGIFVMTAIFLFIAMVAFLIVALADSMGAFDV